MAKTRAKPRRRPAKGNRITKAWKAANKTRRLGHGLKSQGKAAIRKLRG